MHINLLPIPWIGLRAALAIGLAGFCLAGSEPLWAKAIFCFCVAGICGSYRLARIADGHFERILVLMFIPVRTRRWPIDRFTRIETDWGEETDTLWTTVLMGVEMWLFSKACDAIFPWLGGSYKLWLRAGSGKRVLAWQGMSDRSFETNRDLLQNTLGLPVQRK